MLTKINFFTFVKQLKNEYDSSNSFAIASLETSYLPREKYSKREHLLNRRCLNEVLIIPYNPNLKAVKKEKIPLLISLFFKVYIKS